MEFYNKIHSFVRVNFVGRPYELNKLVSDTNIILKESHVEPLKQSYQAYYGNIYAGWSISFLVTLILPRYSSSLSRPTGFLLIFSPALIFYLKGSFSYWDRLKPVVQDSRTYNKNIAQQNYLSLKAESDEKREELAPNLTPSACLRSLFN